MKNLFLALLIVGSFTTVLAAVDSPEQMYKKAVPLFENADPVDARALPEKEITTNPGFCAQRFSDGGRLSYDYKPEAPIRIQGLVETVLEVTYAKVTSRILLKDPVTGVLTSLWKGLYNSPPRGGAATMADNYRLKRATGDAKFWVTRFASSHVLDFHLDKICWFE